MVDTQVIYQVDAFTSQIFKGNPAGVMIVDKDFASERMQNMAMEMNLSETAFVIPADHEFIIRYFTPTTEVPLCGHATLSAAHIIFELGIKKEDESIVFKTLHNRLTVTKESGWLVMDFPRYALKKSEFPVMFKELVGFDPIETYTSNDDWVIAVAAKPQLVKEAKPQFEALEKNGLGHLIITAKSNSPEIDFVSRCFAPMSGINEDPVTGSAHCALTPLWAKILGKTELVAHQISHRAGTLKVALKGDRVGIRGKAVTVFRAVLRT